MSDGDALTDGDALADAGAGYPALVYSNWLDKFFPCRILATGAGGFLIEALYHGEAVKLRVPAAIVYRRPAKADPEPANEDATG
jgi:hypothetical protein